VIREIFVKVHKEKELLREKKLVQNNQPVCGLLKAEVAEVADICCSAEQSLELSLKVSAIFQIFTHTDFLFLHLHNNFNQV
jgi:hypothetical protein